MLCKPAGKLRILALCSAAVNRAESYQTEEGDKMLHHTQTSERTTLILNAAEMVTHRLNERQDVEEICFRELRPTDNIRIRTANSTYTFVVIDAKDRTGLLFGCRYHPSPVPAMLIGAEDLTYGDSSFDDNRLRRGARAIFFTGSQRNPSRLVTSEIICLSYGDTQMQRISR